MGKAGKEDLHLRAAPLGTVLREAAEPHLARGKEVIFTFAPDSRGDLPEPIILRRPELIHGVRNLVQNAVDFAHSRVWVDASWTLRNLTLRIIDDGEGFPPGVLGRIGDPFVRARRSAQDVAARPGYEGMGLGLFIAKTLLERSGATLDFRNSTGIGEGAIVQIVWPRSLFLAPLPSQDSMFDTA
jgi:two-component system sensor histidine kinase RegB